jgi:membrane protease YdiL (CAAX protease family)
VTTSAASNGDATAPPPLPYTRLLRALPSYRWWKPLIALLITVVLWIFATVIVVLIGVVIAAASGQITFDTADAALAQLTKLFGVVDAGNPLSVSIGLIGVATLLPSVLLAYRIVGFRPGSVLRSVAFRLRWRWLAFCLLPAFVITVVATLIQFFLFPVFLGGGSIVAPTIPLGTFLICAVIIIVVTPLQAAAEEFAFRGLITQAVGSWLRSPWLVIVISAIPFAAAHTQYTTSAGSFTWATADVALFALVAGFVTWRTGGIEASIALHAVNNTIAFLTLASSLGGTTSTSAHTDGDGSSLFYSFLVSVITMVPYAIWIDVAARRRKLQNRLYPVIVDGPILAPAAQAPIGE